MATAEIVEVETGPDPSGSVIWLHGLGADGHDFEPLVPELQLPESLSLRFVFPHAPMRPVTINGGMSMRAWYDIISLDLNDRRSDADGIRESSEILNGLIARETDRGIDAAKIVVAGFSQGGAIALHTALRFPHKLAGLMALSTYLPLHESFNTEVAGNPSAARKDLPIFMGHGSFDPMLPMQLGQRSAEMLTTAGYQVEWHDYPMAHAVCAEEIKDIRNWLVSVFAHSE